MGLLRYLVMVEWDEDEHLFVAYAPRLSLSSYGEAREEVLQQMRDSIQVTVEGLQAMGQTVPVLASH